MIRYNPNKGAAIFFCILWFITVVWHIVQIFHYRKWYVSVLIMGGIWEVSHFLSPLITTLSIFTHHHHPSLSYSPQFLLQLVGFILRVVSIEYPLEVKYYAPSLSLIVLAPVVIIAFYYMTLGRMIHLFLPSKRVFRIPARRLTLIFLCGDIFSFLIQMAGTNLLTNNDATPSEFKIGQNILLAGLAVQTGVFAVFILLTWRFEVLYRREFGDEGKDRWRRFMRVLNVCCVCIMIRSIFRLAEFAMPYPGELVTHEVAFYLMEAVPMLPCSYLFHWIHPGEVLVGDESSFRVARRERKRVKREEKMVKEQEEREQREKDEEERSEYDREERRKKKKSKSKSKSRSRSRRRVERERRHRGEDDIELGMAGAGRHGSLGV